MDIMGMDIGQIVDLGTNVAQAGSMRLVETNDVIFDYIIGIVFLVYALDPDLG